MKHKWISGTILAAALMAGSGMMVYGAESTDPSSYSYLAGQQKNVELGTAGGEREGTDYSSSEHLDVESLVEQGIIDQETADSIKAYGSEKHDRIHDRFKTDRSEMTPQQRHEFYESYEKDGHPGDCVDELLSAGLITQEQAEEIRSLD